MAEKQKKKTETAVKRKRFKYIKANAAKCRDCGRIIISEHVHNLVDCDCRDNKGIFVDGGDQYHRRGFQSIDQIIEVPLYWRQDV